MNQGKIITGVIMGLVILVAGLVVINSRDLAEKMALNNEAVFAVIQDGEEVKTYNMSEVADLGETTFTANLKSSGNDPEPHEYTGVLLRSILEDANLDPSGGGNAIVSAIDGYVVGVTNEKLLDESNVYLCYIRDGELIGSREEGDDGPYQLVIRKDQFSQYWCKYAYSVELK